MRSHPSPEFWQALEELVATSRIVVDRAKGTEHPRCPARPYPLDYGHLEGTRAGDGGEIDVWIGSGSGGAVTACGVTLDLLRRDSEIKVLVDCASEDIDAVEEFHNWGRMRIALIRR